MPLDETAPADAATAPWPDIDPRLLGGGRPAPPAFPLDLFPLVWREFTVNIACNSVAPVDYAAMSMLSIVAAAGGAGLVVRVTPAWREPMLLWQAMVGPPSNGQARAFASARYLFDTLPAAVTDFTRPAIVVEETTRSVKKALNGCWRAALLYRDDLGDWLAEASERGERPGWLAGWSAEPALLERRAKEPLRFHQFPVCIAGTLQPDRLADALAGADERLASRLLCCWPEAGAPLAGWGELAQAPVRPLWRIARMAVKDPPPWSLHLTEEALRRLEEIVATLRQRQQEADGLEAAWIGNGQSMVVRLAGLLALMRWSHDTNERESDGLDHVDRRDIDDAWRLWNDYLLPHAQGVFGDAGTTAVEHHARRVVRWMSRHGKTEVSREDIRVGALSKSVDARGADEITIRLESGAVLRPLAAPGTRGRGRPPLRWEVNPALR